MPESQGGATCPNEATLNGCAEGRLSTGDAAQVRAHAATCSRCSARLGDSGETATAAVGPPKSASAVDAGDGDEASVGGASLPRGSSFGRYIVLERVGEGGMGVVHAAYDPELNRKIAIKLLQTGAPGSQGTGGRERLIREAQALARLSHPNVVHVHDVGTHGERVFMAMELVDGRTLRAWLKETPRSWREVTAVFLAAGRGLAAAHAAGLVHRDCKPDNVLISADGQVRVLDFGIARQWESDSPEPTYEVSPASDERSSLSTPLTEVGVVLGTPSYLPPELFNGEPADPRADQFSFCVSLYEALYGERPFPGKLPRNDPQRWKLPEPPRDTQVPAWLRRVVLRGLSLSPEARYPSMDALLSELGRDPRAKQRQWLLGTAIVGLVALVSGGLYLQARSQPAPCQGAARSLAGIWDAPKQQALRTAFLSTGQGFASSAWDTTRRTLDAWAGAWVAMRQEACEATRVRGEQSDEVLSLRMTCLDRRLGSLQALTGLYANADAALVQQAARAATALPGLDLCANVAALRAPVPPPDGVEAHAKVDALRKRLAEGQALFDAARYPPGLELAKSAVESARALAYRPLQAEALELLAGFQEKTGDFNGAEQTLYEALWAAKAGRHDLVAGSASAKLVRVAMLQSRFDLGRHWAEHTRAALEREGGDARTEAYLLMALGSIEIHEGKPDAALKTFEKALPLRVEVYGPNHPDVAAVHNNIGTALRNVGRPRDALAQLEKSLAIYERALGLEHPETGNALMNLGVSYSDLAELEESLHYYRRALEVAEKGLGPDHPNVASALDNIGILLSDQGKYEEALPDFRRAIGIFEAAFGPDHAHLTTVLGNFGIALMGKGDVNGALQAFQRARDLGQRNFPPDHRDMSFAWLNLANAELALNRTAESRAHYELALDIAKKGFESDHPELAAAYFGLGSWHLHQKQHQKGLEHLKKASGIQERSLGEDHPRLAQTLTSLARARLGLRQAEQAVPLLERAITLGQKEGAPPGALEEARFVLARVFWERNKNRARAVELATQARDGYARRGQEKELAEVQAWLTGVKAP